MKNYTAVILSAICIALVYLSCSKDISSRTSKLPPLSPAKNDLNAGDWKTILLTKADEFAVPSPIAINTPDYIAQINEIKTWQANISSEEKAIVDFWSAGAVLRWNEIMRELVAKHNLPPYQNADGSYPVPSAANPLAYPQFPFANPPYAARAYAYVSAAQYDALVSAFYYKKLYNRAPPNKTDATIKMLLPSTDLPSYPSEDAVVIGATVELLKLLFPGDQDYIQQKAEEHRRSRLIAGANVRSELEAGEALGKAVAQKFVSRARTDRAGQAVGTPADWAKLEQNCIDIGETPWMSLESPKRPPMLPMYGKVKAFLFDSATAISLRPPPPPSVHSEKMKQELEEVYKHVKNPSRENIRIVHFWADGVGTSTPPGHWNDIAANDFISKNYSEVRWARNLALLNMAMMDGAIVCWDTKNFYFNPRPSQLNPAIKTVTGLPNFPAYISGHSTFSGAAATVLSYLVPERSALYQAMAQEASLSRIYGGIHFRSDCEEGLKVGKKIGDYAVQRGKTDGAGE
jgi:hypothetical protein